MQPAGSTHAPRLSAVLAAVMAALLLVCAGGTSTATAASALTGAAVHRAQPAHGGDGPASSTEHHAVTPHAAKVGVPKRHGLHAGAAPATLDRSASAVLVATPTEGGARRLAPPDPVARQPGRTRTTGLTGPRASRPPAPPASAAASVVPVETVHPLCPAVPCPVPAEPQHAGPGAAPAGPRCGVR